MDKRRLVIRVGGALTVLAIVASALSWIRSPSAGPHGFCASGSLRVHRETLVTALRKWLLNRRISLLLHTKDVVFGVCLRLQDIASSPNYCMDRSPVDGTRTKLPPSPIDTEILHQARRNLPCSIR